MGDRLTIYGSSDSGNCMKVRWVAEAVGLAFDWIEIGAFNGETRTPGFLKLNPAGQVPVIVFADGRTLAQSNAIMLHLAESSHLAPSDPYERSKMMEWLFWEQYSHEPYIAVRIARLHFLKQREEDLNPVLLTRGDAALARMEQQLCATSYLVGDRLSLADIALVAYTRKAHLGGFDLASYPFVQTWLRRVETSLGLAPGSG